MAKTPNLSLAELESLVEDRRKRLDDLEKKQQSLQDDLDTISQEIAVLEGKGDRRGLAPGKSSGKQKKVRRRRAKNVKPLKEYVTDELKGQKKGRTLQEISDAVLSAGYTTKSKNFKNVLYQCLYNNKEFVHDDDQGTYKLK